MDLLFKDGGEGSIVVVDLAGAEDPVTLIGGYMQVIEGELPTASAAPTWESKIQREKAAQLCKHKRDKLVLKYLHQMGNAKFLDTELAECLEFRDFLVPCSEEEAQKDPKCHRIH